VVWWLSKYFAIDRLIFVHFNRFALSYRCVEAVAHVDDATGVQDKGRVVANIDAINYNTLKP
jgi:hypothetical protein